MIKLCLISCFFLIDGNSIVIILTVIFFFSPQGFITDNRKALEDLFGYEENTRKGDACLNVMATRVATVIASLRVYATVFES